MGLNPIRTNQLARAIHNSTGWRLKSKTRSARRQRLNLIEMICVRGCARQPPALVIFKWPILAKLTISPLAARGEACGWKFIAPESAAAVEFAEAARRRQVPAGQICTWVPRGDKREIRDAPLSACTTSCSWKRDLSVPTFLCEPNPVIRLFLVLWRNEKLSLWRHSLKLLFISLVGDIYAFSSFFTCKSDAQKPLYII